MRKSEHDEALDAARSRLLHASEELHKLLDNCARALAVIDNDPRAHRLLYAAEQLSTAQRRTAGALRAARARIAHAATVVRGRRKGGSNGT